MSSLVNDSKQKDFRGEVFLFVRVQALLVQVCTFGETSLRRSQGIFGRTFTAIDIVDDEEVVTLACRYGKGKCLGARHRI